MIGHLTKKLKETHFGSLSGFSKSTPKPSDSEASKEDAKSATAASSATDDSATPRASSSSQAVSESSSRTVQTESPKPGILVVTLYEARGLALPEEHKYAFLSSQHNQLSRPLGNAMTDLATSARATAPSKTSSASQDSLRQTKSPTEHGFKSTTSRHDHLFGGFLPYALVDFDKTQVFVNSVDGSASNPFWAGKSTQYKFDVSKVSGLTVHIFIRNPNAAPDYGRSQDICLGVVRINPRLEATTVAADRSRSGKDTRRGSSGVEWFDLQDGQGQLHLGVEYAENQTRKLTIDDFELMQVIGKGSFGKVTQVRKKDTKRVYALKSVQKAKIISRFEVTHTLAERSVLAQIKNPFIVPLKFSFQSPGKLYFVLAFVNGGELFYHLTQDKRFDINRSRFYTAELLCALECLHGFNIIYRDLKPENILLDYEGHIALCDFGLCKLEMKDEDHTDTFCGTPEYLAPEVLLGHSYNKAVDWWTLGVLLYEMLVGIPPFYDEDTNEMYRKILNRPLLFPDNDVVPPPAKDLLTKLLNRNPAERLGANGTSEIKSHPFFHSIDWRKLLQRKYEPTFKPNVVNALDTSCINVDPVFTNEAPGDSVVDGDDLSQTMQAQFAGFSYTRPVAGLHNSSSSPGSLCD